MKARKFIAGSVWVAFFSLPLWFFYSWDPFGASITRLSHYKTSRAAIPGVLVEHFPAELPADNAWYYFTHGPLQGDPAMQLLVKPPPSEVNRIYEEMVEVAIERYVAYDFETADDTEYERRSGARMIAVFDANGLDRPPPNGNDHFFETYVGDSAEPARAGVCVNKELGTVVYYCDLGKYDTFEESGDAVKE